MAKGPNTERQSDEGGVHSTMARAAVAAAATGVAAYSVRRFRARQDDPEEQDDQPETDDSDESEPDDQDEPSGKREELTQALSAKVSDAKKAASKLKPGGGADRRSTLDTAWDAASDHLLPVAGDAASSLGASLAKKAPEIVRDELMPRFIEGFQKAAD